MGGRVVVECGGWACWRVAACGGCVDGRACGVCVCVVSWCVACVGCVAVGGGGGGGGGVCVLRVWYVWCACGVVGGRVWCGCGLGAVCVWCVGVGWCWRCVRSGLAVALCGLWFGCGVVWAGGLVCVLGAWMGGSLVSVWMGLFVWWVGMLFAWWAGVGGWRVCGVCVAWGQMVCSGWAVGWTGSA